MDDPFQLQRFVDAQDAHGAYDRALGELRHGRKQSHWIWFVLPQLTSLGRSDMARRYGIAGRAEAAAYARHQVLGPRLRACAEALLESDETDPVAVMGATDARKLRSSMTLFREVAPDEPVFRSVLERFYDGEPDPATLELL